MHTSILTLEYTDFPSSMIYQNVRAMNLNPDFYSEPETFNPDRYIPAAEGGRGEPFPNGNFGFGRRYVAKHLQAF